MVPSGQENSQPGMASQGLPPPEPADVPAIPATPPLPLAPALPPAPPLPPGAGAGSGDSHCPFTQRSPSRTLPQSWSLRHSATQTLAGGAQPSRAVSVHANSSLPGHAETSAHGNVHVPQTQRKAPHAESSSQRCSQCVLLSVPASEASLPQPAAKVESAASSSPSAACEQYDFMSVPRWWGHLDRILQLDRAARYFARRRK
jgi:hypothetical protein